MYKLHLGKLGGIYWWKTAGGTWRLDIDIGECKRGNSIYFHFFENFKTLEWCVWRSSWNKYKPVITEFTIGKNKGYIVEQALYGYYHHYANLRS